MNFDFSDEQKQLRNEARKFLAEKCPPKAVRTVLDGKEPYDRQLWKGLAGMGFLGVAIPEEFGGAGAGHLELCVIAEEIGRALAPVPFSSSVYLAAEAILMAGDDAQKQKWLPLIASGAAIGTLALFEGKGNPSPQAIKLSASGDSLNGVKKPVPDGAFADVAVVAARTGSSGRETDISLFLVDLKADGVEAKSLTNVDPSRGQAELTFRNCRAEPLGRAGEGWSIVSQVLDRAAVLTAFEQVGGADRALEMGRDYALDRIAFGRPIGSFQAVKHMLADMYVSATLARSNCYYGAWALSTNASELPEAAAAARISATQAFQHCAKNNIQVHGGMGFTWEFDCHMYYRRANATALGLGSLSYWEDALIDRMRKRNAAYNSFGTQPQRTTRMNFDDTPQEAAFRAEAKAWIATNAPKQYEEDLKKSSLGRTELKGANILEVAKAWQKKKADAGWACLHWPKEYGGRGATPIERVIWQQEEGAFGKLSGIFIIGHGMCGPTMMAYAGEEQKRSYLPPLASGEKVWCQLFSEPAGGSDVAGLRTRAEKRGDNWIINGQKIWTSGAHYSDYGILLTRTDPNVPKHKGLTMFFLDMKSPGVEIKPIKQANGQSDFNEVYFTDVKIPDSQRLGDVNDGWNVSLTTLMNERMSIGAGVATGFPELFEFCSNLMLEDGLAIDDRNVRSKLAHWAVRASGLKYTSMRAISALSKGERPGPENSIGKLVAGSMIQDVAAYALDLQGAAGVLSGPEAEAAGKFQAMLLRAPGTRVEGGTDEIMRNIIAERVLGLPGDIRVDKDVPFNKIPTKGR